MRKIMLGALGAIAIAILSQGTTFAATHDLTVVTTRQTQLTTSSTSSPSTTGGSILSNQNHSQDQ
jgi:hypothetical protein